MAAVPSPVDPALTAGEQTALNAGSHTIKRYLSVYTPGAIYRAKIGSDPLAFPMYVLPVSVIVPTTVKRGMTVIISKSGVVKGIYRVRHDGDGIGGALYVGESAKADPGLLNIGYRATPVEPLDDVVVYDRFDMWTLFPKLVGSDWYEDTESYASWPTINGSDNLYPDLILNLGKHRSVFLDAGQSYATLAFTCTPIQWRGDAITLTYAWIIPALWTVTVGSSSTASFTARAPAGNYLLGIEVTQDNGSVTRAYRYVWVHDGGGTLYGANPPIPLVDVVSDERDRTGRTMSLGLNNNYLASVPDGAVVNYFEVCTWNGTSVPTATTNMTGWLTRADWRINFGTRRADAAIVGPAEMLKLLGGFSQYVAGLVGTPADFQTVTDICSHLQFIMWYMLRIRSPNTLMMFDFHPWMIDAAYSPTWAVFSNGLPSFTIPKGNLLEQIQTLARSGRYNFGFDSTGAAWIRLHPSEYDPATRDSIFVLRDTLTTNRYTLPLNFSRDMKPKVRRARVNGFLSASVGATPTAYIGEAPDGSYGQGTDEDVVNDYISFTNNGALVQAEINSLAGQIYARDNNPHPNIDFPIPDNRDVYEPAQMPIIDTVVPASSAPDGVGWTTKRGIVNKVSKQHNNNGTARIRLGLEMETAGVAGGTVTVPT